MSKSHAEVLDDILNEYRKEIHGDIDCLLSIIKKRERARIKDAFEKHFVDGGFISPAQLIKVLEGEEYD